MSTYVCRTGADVCTCCDILGSRQHNCFLFVSAGLTCAGMGQEEWRIGAACHFYFQALDIQWAFLHPCNQQIKRASFTRWKEALLCADEGRWRVLLGGQHGRRSLEEA